MTATSANTGKDLEGFRTIGLNAARKFAMTGHSPNVFSDFLAGFRPALAEAVVGAGAGRELAVDLITEFESAARLELRRLQLAGMNDKTPKRAN